MESKAEAVTPFPGVEAEALPLLLDQAGVCASAGSACLSDSDEPSHVVRAMKPASAAARQMIRFSLGLETTEADVDAVGRLRGRCGEMLNGGLSPPRILRTLSSCPAPFGKNVPPPKVVKPRPYVPSSSSCAIRQLD